MYNLTSYQQEIFTDILQSEDRLFCIRAGNGSGLTHMLSMLALEYGNHVEGDCAMMSSSWTCAIKTLGPTLSHFIKEFNLPYNMYYSQYRHKNVPYEIHLVSPDDTENLSSQKNKLIIVDCAATVSEDFVNFLQNECGTCKIVCAGTPTLNGKAFTNLFYNKEWKSYHIASQEVLNNYRTGLATAKWHTFMKSHYGEGSDMYRTRCLGELVA